VTEAVEAGVTPIALCEAVVKVVGQGRVDVAWAVSASVPAETNAELVALAPVPVVGL
jgi:hypothetical protein